MNTGSPGSRLRNTSLPPLVQYRDLTEYTPAYGDFIVWTGFLTTWCGVVANYDKETESLSVIYNGVPFVLFTLTPEEQMQDMSEVKLGEIRNASKGKYAIQQRDPATNATVWYI